MGSRRSSWAGRLAVGVAAAVMVVVSVTGCRRPWMPPVPNLESDPDAVVQQMLDHLQVKYGTTFQVYTANWAGGLLSGNVTTFAVYPTGGIPQDNFEVVSDTSGTQLAFHDGYVGNLMTSTYKTKAQAAISGNLPGSIAVVNNLGSNNTFPDDMSAATTFDQFKVYTDQHIQVIFALYVPLTNGLDKAAIQAMLPALQSELSAIAADGSLLVAGYQADEFDKDVVPAVNDPVQRYGGVPGMVSFFVSTYWRN
jgi:hypothetical protein